jgi:methylmalonyl-CoA/ethylmalonyl-CoA epimerase
MKIHHYGLATKSIEKSIKPFLALGYEICSETIFDPLQGVNLLFLKNENDHIIELHYIISVMKLMILTIR